MSLIKDMLVELNGEEAALPLLGKRSKDNKLLASPTINNIDPVSIANIDKNDKDFDKKIKKRQHEETMMKTKEGGPVPHYHEYTQGKTRTEKSLGHDHAIVYSDEKVTNIGPSPEDGHTHEL